MTFHGFQRALFTTLRFHNVRMTSLTKSVLCVSDYGPHNVATNRIEKKNLQKSLRYLLNNYSNLLPQVKLMKMKDDLLIEVKLGLVRGLLHLTSSTVRRNESLRSYLMYN